LCLDGSRPPRVTNPNFQIVGYSASADGDDFNTIDSCPALVTPIPYSNTEADFCPIGHFIDMHDTNKCKKCPIGAISCYVNPSFDPAATTKTVVTETRAISTECKQGFFLDLYEFICVPLPGTGLVSAGSDEIRYCADPQCRKCSDNYLFCTTCDNNPFVGESGV
jgi:hypothetical protein